MLARFQIQQRAVEQKEREGFEKRNAKLWEGIELAIRQAELRAADEAKELAEARKKQEEAEVKAKLARDAELARIESEKKEQEAKKREEEAKVRAQAEQNEKSVRRTSTEADRTFGRRLKLNTHIGKNA